MSNQLPKFSFSLPTYNAARYLEGCLRSIREQDYPQDRVEILVADGGSDDATVDIARRYDAIVLSNERRLAEYGTQLAMAHATGDLIVIFAADNELGSPDWLVRVARLFESHLDVSTVWGRLIASEEDPPINQYAALIQSDPINYFMNRNLSGYLRTGEFHPGEGNYKFLVDPARGLVWGANGLVYRLALVRDIIVRAGYVGDNDAFQLLMESGHNTVLYVPSLTIYHHTVSSLGHWMGKWRRNYLQHLVANQATRNMRWVFGQGFRFKLVLWLIYSLVPIFSGIHALSLAIKDRNPYWLYHPVTSFAQTWVYLECTLRSRAAQRMLVNLVMHGVGDALRAAAPFSSPHAQNSE